MYPKLPNYFIPVKYFITFSTDINTVIFCLCENLCWVEKNISEEHSLSIYWICSALKMKTVYLSKTLVTTYQTINCYNQEIHNFKLHCHLILIYYRSVWYWLSFI
jgi:hypothetical protein